MARPFPNADVGRSRATSRSISNSSRASSSSSFFSSDDDLSDLEEIIIINEYADCEKLMLEDSIPFYTKFKIATKFNFKVKDVYPIPFSARGHLSNNELMKHIGRSSREFDGVARL